MSKNSLKYIQNPVLLCAINSRYNHTNIAIRSIVYYIQERLNGTNPLDSTVLLPVDFGEWTINQPIGAILRGISKKCIELKHSQDVAPLILFSVYIWNIEITYKVIRELKKILPNCIIGAGGPEVSYRTEDIFSELPELDIIIRGEGEQTTFEMVVVWESCHINESTPDATEFFSFDAKEFYRLLATVPGLFVSSQNIRSGESRQPFTDLSSLPFPYPYLNDPEHQTSSDPLYLDPDNKIFYYESSRGCPFNCAYCMSSIDKRVCFRPLDKVFKDIQSFMDARVKLVKFVDRTFNLKPERYIAIWKYIYEHHNGKTLFHFEIAAEQFTDEALEFLQRIPVGMMQFEIGIQSTNQKTLQAIHREENWDKLVGIVERIPNTIQQHLDLIAGLPYEDLATFGKSFNDVLQLKPAVLQLGFLKVLLGTEMSEYKDHAQWLWMSCPPYEILSTPALSYSDILILKDIETLLDVFWNSKNFKTLMPAIQEVTIISNGDLTELNVCSKGLFGFFSDLVIWCRERNILDSPHRAPFWFSQLDEFLKLWAVSPSVRLHEFLRFDFICMRKTSGFPQWCEHYYQKDEHRKALDKYVFSKNFAQNEHHSTRLAYAHSEYDTFTFDSSEPVKFLFLYPNPVSGNENIPCKVIEIES